MTIDVIQLAIPAVVAAHLDLVKAAVLGLVEGLTEFLPVSSTGHLLLMEQVLGWGGSAFGKSFAVLIQLGAILALLTIYFGRLWRLRSTMFTDWAARALRHRRAARLSAGGGDRRARLSRSSRTYLFDVPRGLRVADRRRLHPAVDRPAEPQAALSTTYHRLQPPMFSSSASSSAFR